MKLMQLVIPMSGQGTRFQAAGFREPKPLVPVSGTPMIQRLLEVFPKYWPTTFVMAENHRNTALPAFLTKIRPNAQQLFVPVHHRGPSWALLHAVEALNKSDPVLVSYCDYSMAFDAEAFTSVVSNTHCDAALVSYRGFHPHYFRANTYAYSRLEGERVVEVKEKGSFTENREQEFASAGTYYFRSADLLQEALLYQIEKNLELNGELYTSLTVQALLEKKKDADVRVFTIPYFFQWGTPEDLRAFEYWEKTFALPLHTLESEEIPQVVMPMAGLGSRFKAFTEIPKPLLTVGGRTLWERALASLPHAQRVFVAAPNFVVAQLPVQPWLEVQSLEHSPAGQAFSTEIAAANCDPGLETMVTACDHAIVLAAEKWQRFRKNPECDAAVFTISGFPGAQRNPDAYSYVAPADSDNSEFPLLGSVSLKKPFSDPASDPVLVGTFWFREASILHAGIARLKEKDERRNGELYLDNIFGALRELGYRSRLIPLDGYINWGDPDSLAEAIYWEEVFRGPRLVARQKYPWMANEEI